MLGEEYCTVELELHGLALVVCLLMLGVGLLLLTDEDDSL